MKILVLGSGAREHALAWKFKQEGEEVWCLWGNGGTRDLSDARVAPHPSLKLLQLARDWEIDLVVVSPLRGIYRAFADTYQRSRIPCFAPSKKAGELEWSKGFAKEFMKRNNIPTAEHRTFIDYEEARAYLSTVTHPVVIKPSGVVAGWGTVFPESQEEAQQDLLDLMVWRKFGHGGEMVVIEELLTGDEISILNFSDGITFRSLPPGQNHRRLSDGSSGPMTCGMGVYAPVDSVSAELKAQIVQDILIPTFRGLRQEGRNFRGILLTSIILTSSGPKLLGYNVGIGDPEAQALIPLLKPSIKLAQICLSCTNGTLSSQAIEVQQGYVCAVSIAAAGYPGKPRKGDMITLHTPPPRVNVFHDGTDWSDEKLLTSAGRVFTVSAVRDTLEEAVEAAYQGVASISFPGMQYRRDIGSRCLGPSTKEEVEAEAKEEVNPEANEEVKQEGNEEVKQEPEEE